MPPLASQPDYLVVIGASTGGVAALLVLAELLPRDFPAPICIVQHIGANQSMLPFLLRRRGHLPALHARDGEQLLPGTIYVAPPDHHLLVEGPRLRLTRGPRENHTRPAIDPLFRSAALHWGSRAIGVVLTGHLDDGTAGLWDIKDRGGITVAQDPATAEEPAMPASAIANVAVDHVVRLADMGVLLRRLVDQPVPPAPAPRIELEREVAIVAGEATMENLGAIAKPSSLTCPDCAGALWEVDKQRPLRYRCHTGHSFTALTLEQAQLEASEFALRSSVRALQEREMLLRRMAAVAEATGEQRQADAARTEADRLRRQVKTLRGFTDAVDEGQESGPA